MLKLISFMAALAATPLAAQNCVLLCDMENWMAGGPQFILDAIANGEDLNGSEGVSLPLVMAITLGPVEMVQPLLAAGADPNIADSRGTNALLAAANAPDTGIIPLLIAAGADVNTANNRGETALHFAAAGILLTAGADLNLQNNEGQTALHIAAKGRSPLLVSQLLAAGANGSLLDANGRTAFDVAEETMHLAKVPQVWAALEAAQ